MATPEEQPSFIESEDEYHHALSITRGILMNEQRTTEDTRRLKTWAVLIRDYERRHYPKMFEVGMENEGLACPNPARPRRRERGSKGNG
jgi:hypothetical protein